MSIVYLNSIHSFFYAALLCLCLYLTVKVYFYHKRLDKQNLDLISLYLDKKLLGKLLNYLLNSNKENLLNKVITEIKTYYLLQNICILQSINGKLVQVITNELDFEPKLTMLNGRWQEFESIFNTNVKVKIELEKEKSLYMFKLQDYYMALLFTDENLITLSEMQTLEEEMIKLVMLSANATQENTKEKFTKLKKFLPA